MDDYETIKTETKTRLTLTQLVGLLKDKDTNIVHRAKYSMWKTYQHKLQKLDEREEELEQNVRNASKSAELWYNETSPHASGANVVVEMGSTSHNRERRAKTPWLESQSPYEVTKEQTPFLLKAMQARNNLRGMKQSIRQKINRILKENGVKEIQTLHDLRADGSNNFGVYADAMINKLQQKLHFLDREVNGRVPAKTYVVNKLLAFFDNWQTSQEYHNIIFMGRAGTGKSYMSLIFADILAYSGILLTNTVLEKSRADFVGEYMGQTAIKTNGLLSAAYEGVLFLDEAYDLARWDKTKKDWDSYGQEAATEIIAFLSRNRGNIAFFAAGYEKDMTERFLACNEGMPRRFPTMITLEDYDSEAICNMFSTKVERTYAVNGIKWNGSIEFLKRLYSQYVESSTDNMSLQYVFNNQAGDIQNLADRMKGYLSLSDRPPYTFKDGKAVKKTINIYPCDIAWTIYQYAKDVKRIDFDQIKQERESGDKVVAPTRDLEKLRTLLFSLARSQCIGETCPLDCTSSIRDSYKEGIDNYTTPETKKWTVKDEPAVSNKKPAASLPANTTSDVLGETTVPNYFLRELENYLTDTKKSLGTRKKQKGMAVPFYQEKYKKYTKKKLIQVFKEKWKAYHELDAGGSGKIKNYGKSANFYEQTTKKDLIENIMMVDFEIALCNAHLNTFGNVSTDPASNQFVCPPPGGVLRNMQEFFDAKDRRVKYYDKWCEFFRQPADCRNK